MTSPWRRLGRLPLDTTHAPWAKSHAALPCVEPAGDEEWVVYLSPRDARGRSRIGRCRLRLDPPRLSPLEPEPVLDLGALGGFDDSGVTSAGLVCDGDRRLLYYTGWSRGVTVPFYTSVGLAVSERGARFERTSPAPLFDRSAADPFLTVAPFVLLDDGRWRMWYVSATEWRVHEGQPRHFYNIRYADSADGLSWRRPGTVCIDYQGPDEYAISRGCVIREANGYRMWFAARGDRYVISSATSPDGEAWTRDDRAGMQPSETGWDSDMVAYPWVFDAGGRRYMLYNGNGYGRTGIGLAVWEAA